MPRVRRRVRRRCRISSATRSRRTRTSPCSNLLARLGAGFDIVSGGELARVIAAGGDPQSIVFSGVGKTEAEMEAALDAGILCFNVESAAELEVLDAVAGRIGTRRAGLVARQSRRRPEDASVHRDRTEGKQVRRRLRRRAGALPARGGLPQPRRARHRLPHRLADHRARGLRRGGGKDVRARRPDRGRRASRSSTSTSAAASASATATRRRSRSPTTRACVRAARGAAPPPPAVRAGPRARRRRRRAADARRATSSRATGATSRSSTRR